MRICTTNPGKIAEFGGLLAPLDIKLTPTMDHDIPETGDTFAANALEKSLGYAKLYPGEWLLAEDSGLVIPALGGLPGAFSARFHQLDLDTRILDESQGEMARKEIDPLNNDRVLTLLKGTPLEARGAYFVSHIIVIDPTGQVAFRVERRSYGWILESCRGSNGFGYDPLFESPESFGQTWAEIDSARKGLISHRSKAVWDLMAWLCSTGLEVS